MNRTLEDFSQKLHIQNKAFETNKKQQAEIIEKLASQNRDLSNEKNSTKKFYRSVANNQHLDSNIQRKSKDNHEMVQEPFYRHSQKDTVDKKSIVKPSLGVENIRIKQGIPSQNVASSRSRSPRYVQVVRNNSLGSRRVTTNRQVSPVPQGRIIVRNPLPVRLSTRYSASPSIKKAKPMKNPPQDLIGSINRDNSLENRNRTLVSNNALPHTSTRFVGENNYSSSYNPFNDNKLLSSKIKRNLEDSKQKKYVIDDKDADLEKDQVEEEDFLADLRKASKEWEQQVFLI